jgi:3-oxoacyl-[acyl-carrier protein] reductase
MDSLSHSLVGEVVLITGASRGLGAAIARTAAAYGAAVAVNYLQSEEAAEGLAAALRSKGAQAAAFQGDVTDGAAVAAMVEAIGDTFGPITGLVNNALVSYRFDPGQRKPGWEVTWADFQRQLEGTVKAAHHTLQAVLPMMRQGARGRIVNIGTNLVQSPVVPYHDYIAAKGALVGLTRSMAFDLGPFGITVNMVTGGLLEGTDASAAATEQVKDAIRAQTPLRRITQPEDVAAAVAFLLSPAARAITGQELLVDGGMVMR